MPPVAGRLGASKYRARVAGSKPAGAHAASPHGRAASAAVTGTMPAATAMRHASGVSATRIALTAPAALGASRTGQATAPDSHAPAIGGHATSTAAQGAAAAPGSASASSASSGPVPATAATNRGGGAVSLGDAAVERFRRRVCWHGRRHYRTLPWRETSDPYAILVSEVMLQQTQVTRVLDYYPRFLARFPDPASLAAAPLAAVLERWSGLGYNRRALALHRAAGVLAREHAGAMPAHREALLRLPGVGPATAGALLAFAFGRPAVFIETNIRRVFIDQFFAGAAAVPDAALHPLIARTLDRRRPRRWYYALMDWGAALGRRAGNPNRRSAHYTLQSPFAGSRRELRGRVIRLLTERRCLAYADLQAHCHDRRLAAVVAELVAERFLERAGVVVCIAGHHAPPGGAGRGPDTRDFTAFSLQPTR